MNVIKRLRIWIAVLALSLVAGVAVTGITQAVNTPSAQAFYITIKVSPSSERTIRVSDLSNGYGIKKNVKPGHYSPIAVQSVQVDNSCELYKSGSRIAKRKDHDWWYNFSEVPHSKATLSLVNCRSGGRGDRVGS